MGYICIGLLQVRLAHPSEQKGCIGDFMAILLGSHVEGSGALGLRAGALVPRHVEDVAHMHAHHGLIGNEQPLHFAHRCQTAQLTARSQQRVREWSTACVAGELEKSAAPLRSFACPLAHGVVHDVCRAEVEVAARIEVYRLLLYSPRLAIHVVVHLEGVR